MLIFTNFSLNIQVKEVFWYFNVQPDEKYVFSRCPKCNNRSYITIKGNIMLQLHQALNSMDDSQNHIDDKTICLPHAKNQHQPEESCKFTTL